ncbi:MAG: type III polyketide synthase, partial [Alphaproteobacteria bacterium]
LYLESATALFVEAARNALADAGLAASDIDTVVTISSTGIATPTLEARAFGEIGFRSDLHRVPVFGLGCAGGVSGMAIAARLARAMPGSNVLMVSIETCTLNFRDDRLSKADVIASVLFGDGAAAACLTTGDAAASAPAIGEGEEHLWPDTLGIMGWDVDAAGFGVIFDRSIPSFVEAHFRDAAAACLA